MFFFFFFFNDTATTEIYTLSLHDALPILGSGSSFRAAIRAPQSNGNGEFREISRCLGTTMGTGKRTSLCGGPRMACGTRSEEHTSELQSQSNLVCRLLLEKKK